jgi:hypothetical protein
VITVVFRSAFIRPHGGLLSNQTAFLESQPIHTIQEVLRRTLSKRLGQSKNFRGWPS